MNHLWNQVIYLVSVIGCKDVRNFVLFQGIRNVSLMITTFVVCYYYLWIWVCWFSLDKWPYPFLDLHTSAAKTIYAVIVAACYVVVCVMYCFLGLVEEKFGGRWKTKGLPPSRMSPRLTPKKRN